MSGIDLEYARKSFQEYLSAYDAKDEKIKLKRVHTFCVVKAAEYITTREKISEEDKELALLIALLHDIGRFEQLKKYNSYDDNIMDHAKLECRSYLKKGKSVILSKQISMTKSFGKPFIGILLISCLK